MKENKNKGIDVIKIDLMIDVDAPFCPGYYGSSTPKKKKKLIAKRRKVVQGIFREGCFLTSNFGPIFDLLNGIIWTSSPTGNLFKIKFSSQVDLNHVILMDRLKAMD